MRAALLLAAFFATAVHAAEEFQPSRSMIRFAEWAIGEQENGNVEHALSIARKREICPNEPARLHCREYLLFVAGYIQERQAWSGPADERDKWLDGALADYAEAWKSFQAPSILANVGAIHTARGRYDLALKAFDEAEAMAPNACARECALARGQALERTGRFDEALGAYRRAHETADDAEAGQHLLGLLGVLTCRERRTDTAPEILTLSARLASDDPGRARYALECLMAAAGPDHPVAEAAAVRWLDLSPDSDERTILDALPPRPAAELRLLLLGSTRVQDAVWWSAGNERRRAAARFLLARAKRADANRGTELALRAKEIAPPVDADAVLSGTPVRADAVIELLYRHASAPDDRREAIDGLANEALAEFERARRPSPEPVAQIGVLAAAAHRQRHRYAEAVQHLRRTVEIVTRWNAPQPHVNLLLAETYGAMQNADGQREQYLLAAAGYAHRGELDGAERTFEQMAEAGFDDDEIRRWRQITAVKTVLAERGDDATTLSDLVTICNDTKGQFVFVEQCRAVADFVRNMAQTTHGYPMTSGTASESITAKSLVPLSDRAFIAAANRPLERAAYTTLDDRSPTSLFGGATTFENWLISAFKEDDWSGAVEYDRLMPSAAGPSFTTWRGGERERVSAGGPWRDKKLWFFASVDSLDLNQSAVGGTPNDSEQRELMGRVTHTLNSAVTLALNGSRTDSTELNAGASPSRAASAQQTAHRDRAAVSLMADVSFQPRFFGRVIVQRTRRRWSRAAQSSVEPLLGADGIWRDNINVRDEEISHRARLDGTTFAVGATRAATLRGGIQLERFRDTMNRFTDFDVLTIHGTNIGDATLLSPPIVPSISEYWRSGETANRRDSGLAWLHGEFVLPSLAVNAAIEYETWRGRGEASVIDANRASPALLPATTVPDTDFSPWGTFVYRLGVTYRMFTFSASRFPSQLTPSLVAFGQLDSRDLLRTAIDGQTPIVGSGIDPSNPNMTSNIIDPALRPEMIESVAAGVEHTIFGASISLNGEYRQTRDVMELRPLLRDVSGAVRPAEATDYSLQGRIRGAEVYYVHPDTGRFTGGALLTNGDRQRQLSTATLTVVRNWQPVTVRLTGTARRHDWHLGPDYHRFDDPTETIQIVNAAGLPDADVEEEVAETFFGSDTRALSYAAARWTASGSAIYKAELGEFQVTVGTDLRLSEGDVRPAYTTTLTRDGRIVRVRMPGPADRYPVRRDWNASVHVVRPLADGRELWTEVRAANLLDDRSDLRRIHDLRSPRAGALEETRPPRSFEVRIGYRWGVQ